MPEKRFRPKKRTNYAELVERGVDGLKKGIYSTRIEAGRALALDAKNYAHSKEKGEREYSLEGSSEQMAVILARMIGKAYRETE